MPGKTGPKEAVNEPGACLLNNACVRTTRQDCESQGGQFIGGPCGPMELMLEKSKAIKKKKKHAK